MRLTAISLLALLFLAGCTGASPEILTTDARFAVHVDPESAAIRETVRLYVAIEDADGPDDPSLIRVEHEGSALSWEIGRDDWTQIDYAGDQWYGVSELRAASGDALPRGRYLLVVEDQSLSEATSEFFITAVVPDDEIVFPQLTGDRDAPRVEYNAPVILRVYGRAGQLRLSQVIRPGAIGEDVRSRIPDESGVSAYLESINQEPHIIVGPYQL